MEIYDMALSFTPGIGSVTASRLIEQFFSAEHIFAQPHDKLIAVQGVTESIANAIYERSGFNLAEREMEYCQRNNIKPIALTDPEYPPMLRKIHNPPYIIYVMGDHSILTHNLISMVGTRECGGDAPDICNKIVGEIGREIHNPVIVSGLAFGIDSHCHRSALDHNIPTIAVLASPLPNFTPKEHTHLANQILENGGAIISEMHSRTRSARNTFISRNRIIAGVSEATIIVQSGESGGAMTTMEMAKEMGRQPFAVPGSITNKYHKGCNKLIAFRDAHLYRGALDLVRILSWRRRQREESVEEYIEKREAWIEDKIDSGAEVHSPKEFSYELLKESHKDFLLSMMSPNPIHVSDLEKMNPMAIHDFNSILIELEIFGAIRSLPGSRYQRIISIEPLKTKNITFFDLKNSLI